MTTAQSRLDDRAKQVLRYLVQSYLHDGNPVGSRTLANNAVVPYSPATIRNVMSDLEDIGFLVSPHTSAGRIPSPRGIRFFIDQLLTVTPPEKNTLHRLENSLRRETTTEVHTAGANIISQLTQYVGFVAMPISALPVVRKLRFVKLSSCRILAVIVTDSGDVLNRIFTYDRDVSETELNAAATVYNRYFADMTFSEAQKLMYSQLLELREQIGNLLKSLLEKVDEKEHAAADENSGLYIAGESNLLKDENLSGDMHKLRELYDLLEQKKEMLRLLKRGDNAADVSIFIGSESGLSALDECSVVFSSCGQEEDGKPLGLIGVIGPKRMRYNRVIPTVGVAAKLLGNVLETLRLPSQ
ncbi:MAG: heat-inducible transcriptional repressor HrcA [Proteobacteria bacterium]|nr:heat-inducible transcriptional repressor HrcA [Pseudomonadota bacterium]MCH9757508.1 heat-inducible transcriptional repressor HrcA [Pseudomonadota bacterium]